MSFNTFGFKMVHYLLVKSHPIGLGSPLSPPFGKGGKGSGYHHLGFLGPEYRGQASVSVPSIESRVFLSIEQLYLFMLELPSAAVVLSSICVEE